MEAALIRVSDHQANNLREQLQQDDRGLLRIADILLPGDDAEMGIIVDQFEEVFTLIEDEHECQHLLDFLHCAVSNVRNRVVVT